MGPERKSPGKTFSRGRQPGGVITVFFTLLSVLFLGLFFALIESARFQGARARAANITDMAHYSAFSEYEKMLLKEYEIFGVDGSYGSGDFSIRRFGARLQSYMQENAEPGDGLLNSFFFDPWQVRVSDCKIQAFALLTDDGAEPFYQQAVAYMRSTAITRTAGTLLNLWQQAGEAERKQKQYEKEKTTADRELKELEEKEAELEQEQENTVSDPDGLIVETPEEFEAERARQAELARQRKKLNPIPALRRLARRDLLEITCGNAQISGGSTGRGSLIFSRHRQQGTWHLPPKYRGLLNNLYFKEYLLDHFGNFRSVREGRTLSYEIEYILGGKRTDRENLKETVKRLLLLREGSNYLFCVSDEMMNAQAGTLSALLIGWTGIPALTAVLKHSLLLGWAYAESLLDVRTLMEGGRVPLAVTGDDWVLTLEQLPRINELLEETRKDTGGLAYHGYLRLLLHLQDTAVQKKRGLELIELRIARAEGLSNFRADHLIVAVRDRTGWRIPPLFSRVTRVFTGLAGQEVSYAVPGGFSCQPQ